MHQWSDAADAASSKLPSLFLPLEAVLSPHAVSLEQALMHCALVTLIPPHETPIITDERDAQSEIYPYTLAI